MITVNHCGCDSKHMPPFEMLRRDGSRDYTILLVKTGACFWLDGKRHETRPNMAILYDKEVPVRYGCADSVYSDDWLHFDLTQDEDILDQLQIPFQTPLYLSLIHILKPVTVKIQPAQVLIKRTKRSSPTVTRRPTPVSPWSAKLLTAYTMKTACAAHSALILSADRHPMWTEPHAQPLK